MKFVKSDGMKITVNQSQKDFISTPEYAAAALKRENVIGFDIFDGEEPVAFAMLRKYTDDNGIEVWFLWEYAVDEKFQGRGYGKKALEELITLMKNEFDMKIMTTTYVWGNTVAKNLYESMGFVETDVVDEPDCHEVNMIYYCK